MLLAIRSVPPESNKRQVLPSCLLFPSQLTFLHWYTSLDLSWASIFSSCSKEFCNFVKFLCCPPLKTLLTQILAHLVHNQTHLFVLLWKTSIYTCQHRPVQKCSRQFGITSVALTSAAAAGTWKQHGHISTLLQPS